VKTLQRNIHCWELLPIKTSESMLRRLRVEISNTGIVICSYDLYVVNNLWLDGVSAEI
jgi:hypothetical protein